MIGNLSVGVVRAATVDDVGLLAALRRAWVDEDHGDRVDDDAFAERFAAWFAREHARRRFWIALEGDAPIGMLNLIVIERMPKPKRAADHWGHISNTYVVPEARDRGVGRALLDAAIGYAREHRFERLVLNPSPRSVAFYMRAGFAPAGSLLVLAL